METVSTFSGLIAALCGIVAAFYWLCAAKVLVEPVDKPDEAGIYPSKITDEDQRGKMYDVVETGKRQSKLNGRAAYWGAATAFFVALSQASETFLKFQ